MPKLLNNRYQNRDYSGVFSATGPGNAKYPNLWNGLWGAFNPVLSISSTMRNFGYAGGKQTATSFAGVRPYKFGKTGVMDATAYWNGGNSKLTGATSITFAAHTYITTFGPLPRFISVSNGSNHEIHMFTAGADKKLKFELWNGTVDVFDVSTSVIPENRFVHLATVWLRGTGISFYIDGKLDRFVSTATTGTVNPTDGFAIGARSSSVADTRYVGEQGESLIYTRALGAGEIALLASGASPLTPFDAIGNAREAGGTPGSGGAAGSMLLTGVGL